MDAFTCQCGRILPAKSRCLVCGTDADLRIESEDQAKSERVEKGKAKAEKA